MSRGGGRARERGLQSHSPVLPDVARGGASGSLVLVDVGDRVTDGADLFGFLIADLEIELLLHRHDDLDEVERIGVQVIDERGILGNLVSFHAEALRDDALYAFEYSGQACSSLFVPVRRTGAPVSDMLSGRPDSTPNHTRLWHDKPAFRPECRCARGSYSWILHDW